MNKKEKNLLILLLILVVLVIAFLGTKTWNQKQEEKQAAKEEEEQIVVFETDSLEALSYEDFIGKVMAFEKVDGVWKYTEDTSVTLQENMMDSMEQAFCQIVAEREIADPDSLADYGLEEPAYRLTLSTDGKSCTFLVGDATGENYYFMEEGGQSVYTVSSSITSEMVWDLSSLEEVEEEAEDAEIEAE